MARPRKELEEIEFNGWEQLDALIVWANEAYCADKLGISVETLATRIKEKFGVSFPEYKLQKQEPMRINVMKKQYEVAMTGNVPMLIWWGKNYLGQSDKVDSSITGAKGSDLLGPLLEVMDGQKRPKD